MHTFQKLMVNSMFFLNKNPAGKVTNVLFGLAELVDGSVRLLSLGFIATGLTSTVSRWQVERHIKRLKKGRNKA